MSSYVLKVEGSKAECSWRREWLHRAVASGSNMGPGPWAPGGLQTILHCVALYDQEGVSCKWMWDMYGFHGFYSTNCIITFIPHESFRCVKTRKRLTRLQQSSCSHRSSRLFRAPVKIGRQVLHCSRLGKRKGLPMKNLMSWWWLSLVYLCPGSGDQDTSAYLRCQPPAWAICCHGDIGAANLEVTRGCTWVKGLSRYVWWLK